MGSFNIQYEQRDDTLEVDFGGREGGEETRVALNDLLFLYVDPSLRELHGIVIYNFSRLMEVSEIEFTDLAQEDESLFQDVLSLLSRPPGNLFFELTDPEEGIARIQAPHLLDMMRF
jgi:hypothetical protein